ncbi:DUF3221 domain-containing protein [Sporosarcina sp. UB5]|uniref:DUF3221 domain-containing protein n=1 Tax=Sporosarcina sp. UB5 TaxID=3047463 RepID=UPI003D78EE19
MKYCVSILLGAALLLGGCEDSEMGASPQNSSVEDSGWPMLIKVSGREIIAELKQTVEETPKRDERATFETPPGVEEPSKETMEDLNVKAIEGPAVFEAVEKVYGEGGIHHEGVIFNEYQTSGAEQSAVWVGIKEPDERVQQLLDLLQPKVDAGEILAEAIYIFRSPHTEKELYDLQEEVAQALKGMQTKGGSFGLYANVVTGDIEITHDFLRPEQQEELRKMFADHTLNFEQDGRMIPEPGQSRIITPEQTYTDTPVTEGGFILSAGEGRFFVGGGTEDVVYYKFSEADKLKVGQRVKVERSGPIMKSYPGQGTAKFVEILPDYKPANAKLSESQAVAKVLEMASEKLSNGFSVIDEVSFDEKEKKWIFKLWPEDGEGALEVKDQ